MRLKKLEISGFKSFANKTALEFPFTINAIVGPNGSGKSNVVDAIRWVLGEQSFKNLRSKSGADLIWSGSASKPSQGKAGANLHFDNRDGFFPIDFEEVVIGRKVFRDGASEYYLNNSQVRLKDIAELLARSKLGLRGHSIVNQGSADEILKSDPKERRSILEESLGLREFQLKKTEAEAKLLETGANLEQTTSLINEIFPHLRSLKRQVEKFKKREFLMNDLNSLENEYFQAKVREISAQRNENQKLKNEFNAKIVLAKQIFEAKEKAFEREMGAVSQTSEKIRTIEVDLEKLNAKRNDILREFGRLEGLIESAKKIGGKNSKTLEAVLAIKTKYWAKRLDAAFNLNDADATREAIKNIGEEIKIIANYLERGEVEKILALVDLSEAEEKNENPYEKDQEILNEQLRGIEVQMALAKEASRKIRLEENDWRARYMDFQRELELARREYVSVEEAAQKFELEEEKIKIKETDVKSEMWGAGKNYDEFSIVLASESNEGAPIIALAEMENKIIKLRREISDIGSIDDETMREYEETNKRHEFLTAEYADLTQAVGSLKSLISDLTVRVNNDFKIGLARISDEFDRYFKLMFGGGSSKLTVENYSVQNRSEENGNVVENGVVISVNMPQKRIKDLNLLSGGERSLVSIALLFAIVSASEPPFLVLDEVDAALDESNAVRFAKVLKDLAKKTQFVMITHNRSTMEAAEVLYGVTMGDDGASKLFSLKFEDAVV